MPIRFDLSAGRSRSEDAQGTSYVSQLSQPDANASVPQLTQAGVYFTRC
jgi:hypothetical protein